MPTHRKQLGARRFIRSNGFIFFPAVFDNIRNRSQCFDIINNRGAAIQSFDGWKGRFISGLSFFSFDGIHQSCFIADYISASALVNRNIAGVIRPFNFLAQIASFVSFFYCLLSSSQGKTIFASEINIGMFGLNGIAAQDHPFDKLMRIFFQNHPIFKSAWLAFIAIADQIDRLICSLGQE